MTSRKMPAIVNENIDAAEGVERGLDDRLGALRLDDRQRRGIGFAAGLSDRGNGVLRRAGVETLALQAGAISQTTTRAPSAASSIAMARPMPRPAPVTMATLPATIPGI